MNLKLKPSCLTHAFLVQPEATLLVRHPWVATEGHAAQPFGVLMQSGIDVCLFNESHLRMSPCHLTSPSQSPST